MPENWEISADYTDYADFLFQFLCAPSWDRIKRLRSKLFAPVGEMGFHDRQIQVDRFEKTATEFFVNLESHPDDLIGLILCRYP
jgi:hypothetical protein